MKIRLNYLHLLLAFVVFPISTEAATNGGNACSRSLHHLLQSGEEGSVPSLPDACSAIGPVHLGMRDSDVVAILGDADKTMKVADHSNTVDMVYIYPRNLAEAMVKHPVPAENVHFSELAIHVRDGKVESIAAFVNPGSTFPFSFLGYAVGTRIDRVLDDIGGAPQWNSSRDYVQYAPLPLGISVDPDKSTMVGLAISTSKQGFDGADLPGISLIKDEHTGLVRGFR